MGLGKYSELMLCLIMFPASIMAAAMLELGLKDMATMADKVVQGNVTAVVTRWDKDSTSIYTYVRVNIIDDLIGEEEDNEIIIKILGGSIGDLTLEVDGAAEYQAGEETILFLLQDPGNLTVAQTLGMYQGKYRIYMEGGEKKVSQAPAAGGVKLVKRAGVPAVQTGNGLPLEEFKKTVLEYLKNR